MENNILLPTDFSDNAWSAAVYALKLYADKECAFYFLHATKMRVSKMSNFSNKLTKIMSENAKKDMAELKELAETANANANHKFHTILSTDELQIALETAIKKYNVNLVVIGTNCATKAKELLLGSNTVRTINKIKSCPILIVPEEYDFVLPNQIAFATNFEREYGDKELRLLKNMATLYNSKIRAVCVKQEGDLNETQEYNCSMLETLLSDFDISCHFMPDYAKKTVEINDFIEELDIDILAMVNYKHSFIENITKEPVIKKIGYHPIIPFLVIPE